MNKYLIQAITIFSLCLVVQSQIVAQKGNVPKITKSEDSFQEYVEELYIERDRIVDSIIIANLPPPPPPINYDTVLVLSMLRTPCYGKCPHYEFWIYASGRAVYEGKAHVEKIGTYETFLDSNLVVDLAKEAANIDYYGFSDAYPAAYNSKLNDFPLCVTSVFWEDRKKTIYNRNFAPPALVRYERMLDEAIESVEKWDKIEK